MASGSLKSLLKIESYDAKKRPTYSTSSAEGLLTVDVEKKAPASLLMVFNGTWKNVTPYDQPVASAAVASAAVISVAGNNARTAAAWSRAASGSGATTQNMILFRRGLNALHRMTPQRESAR